MERTGQRLAWEDARVDFRRPLAVLALFAAVAGISDGVSLSSYGVFVANQTGNVVHVGMGAVGAFDAWPQALASILLFGSGAALGHGLSRDPRAGALAPPVRILLLAWALFTAYAVLATVVAAAGTAQRVGLVGVGSLAMGALAVVFVRTGSTRSTTTYETGMVVQTAQALWDAAGPAQGGGPGGADAAPTGSRAASTGPGARVRLGVLGLVAYATGGALGTLAVRTSGWLLLTASAALLATLGLARFRRVPPAAG